MKSRTPTPQNVPSGVHTLAVTIVTKAMVSHVIYMWNVPPTYARMPLPRSRLHRRLEERKSELEKDEVENYTPGASAAYEADLARNRGMQNDPVSMEEDSVSEDDGLFHAPISERQLGGSKAPSVDENAPMDSSVDDLPIVSTKSDEDSDDDSLMGPVQLSKGEEKPAELVVNSDDGSRETGPHRRGSWSSTSSEDSSEEATSTSGKKVPGVSNMEVDSDDGSTRSGSARRGSSSSTFSDDLNGDVALTADAEENIDDDEDLASATPLDEMDEDTHDTGKQRAKGVGLWDEENSASAPSYKSGDDRKRSRASPVTSPKHESIDKKARVSSNDDDVNNVITDLEAPFSLEKKEALDEAGVAIYNSLNVQVLTVSEVEFKKKYDYVTVIRAYLEYNRIRQGEDLCALYYTEVSARRAYLALKLLHNVSKLCDKPKLSLVKTDDGIYFAVMSPIWDMPLDNNRKFKYVFDIVQYCSAQKIIRPDHNMPVFVFDPNVKFINVVEIQSIKKKIKNVDIIVDQLRLERWVNQERVNGMLRMMRHPDKYMSEHEIINTDTIYKTHGGHNYRNEDDNNGKSRCKDSFCYRAIILGVKSKPGDPSLVLSNSWWRTGTDKNKYKGVGTVQADAGSLVMWRVDTCRGSAVLGHTIPPYEFDKQANLHNFVKYAGRGLGSQDIDGPPKHVKPIIIENFLNEDEVTRMLQSFETAIESCRDGGSEVPVKSVDDLVSQRGVNSHKDLRWLTVRFARFLKKGCGLPQPIITPMAFSYTPGDDGPLRATFNFGFRSSTVLDPRRKKDRAMKYLTGKTMTFDPRESTQYPLVTEEPDWKYVEPDYNFDYTINELTNQMMPTDDMEFMAYLNGTGLRPEYTAYLTQLVKNKFGK